MSFYLSKNKELQTKVEGMTIIVQATPNDANDDEKTNKRFCICLVKEIRSDKYKVYHSVISIKELKKLLGISAKEQILWEDSK